MWAMTACLNLTAAMTRFNVASLLLANASPLPADGETRTKFFARSTTCDHLQKIGRVSPTASDLSRPPQKYAFLILGEMELRSWGYGDSQECHLCPSTILDGDCQRPIAPATVSDRYFPPVTLHFGLI